MGAIKIPDILLPADGVKPESWAVIACDQFTSEPEYWRGVERLTAGLPSTYNLIFPEIYLDNEPEKRIAQINENMREYLSGGVFKEIKSGFILVERTTLSGMRTGIVLAVDLEEYSYSAGAGTLIRSTEGTVEERIPPRVAIRKNAPLELPHAMLLYNDKQNSVLKKVKRGKVLYDFDLMCGGGRVKGTLIKNPQEVEKSFYGLLQTSDGGKTKPEARLLFAVGDGNHSLATAKTCWEALKPSLSEKERENHPAKFALAEAVNIYDKSMSFKPIHRFVKTENPSLFIDFLKTSGAGEAYTVIEGKKRKIPFNADIPAGIRGLDKQISDFIEAHGGSVDYIHGEENLVNLTETGGAGASKAGGATKSGGAGVILPAVKKDDFFNLIITGGNLPRKTFSIGEACEKRYYIEAKRIKQG